MRNSENVRFPTKIECEPNYDIHYKTEIYSSTLTPIHIRLKIIRTIKKSKWIYYEYSIGKFHIDFPNYLFPSWFVLVSQYQ